MESTIGGRSGRLGPWLSSEGESISMGDVDWDPLKTGKDGDSMIIGNGGTGFGVNVRGLGDCI